MQKVVDTIKIEKLEGGIETNFDNDAYSWYKVVPVCG